MALPWVKLATLGLSELPHLVDHIAERRNQRKRRKRQQKAKEHLEDLREVGWEVGRQTAEAQGKVVLAIMEDIQRQIVDNVTAYDFRRTALDNLELRRRMAEDGMVVQ